MVAANPLVREDAGKVAFVRGPLAYCAEGVDNGANLHLLHADTARIASDPSCVSVDRIVFHAGAAAQDEQGLGEVDAVDMPMTTLAPMEKPLKKNTSILTIMVVEPTAARAWVLTNCPTTTESTVL